MNDLALEHWRARAEAALAERDAARDELVAGFAKFSQLHDAAKALYEEVEMAESVGICLPDRVPSLRLRDLL